MAIGTYLGAGGVKELKECYVGAGAVKTVKEIYVGVGGAVKLVWSSGAKINDGVEGIYTAKESITKGDFVIIEGTSVYKARVMPFHGISLESASSGQSVKIIQMQ